MLNTHRGNSRTPSIDSKDAAMLAAVALKVSSALYKIPSHGKIGRNSHSMEPNKAKKKMNKS
jgi:hypothetical protein